MNRFHGWRCRVATTTAKNSRSPLLAVEELERRLTPAAPFAEFVDPHPVTGDGFGKLVVPLSTGNVVVTAPGDNAGGVNAGAVYLFNGATGALISTLTGSHSNDQVGALGITVLSNGNFVVKSPRWDNGSATDVGAATWGSGVAGVSGVVSAANSLVGSTTNDQVGNIVYAVGNGNYVVGSQNWTNAGAGNAGAVTWGDGTVGVKGAVTAANSLVGSTMNDQVGAYITVLRNGNYVVTTPLWDSGSVTDVGAATWGSGAAGVKGTIHSGNSLIGGSKNDQVGIDGVTPLTSGNYVVISPAWGNGTLTLLGAATWGNGASGTSGLIGPNNSLVGSQFFDRVGMQGVTALANGNYVVASPSWQLGSKSYTGAATWGNGTTGITGTISAGNSLVGSKSVDNVANRGVVALPSGNYLVVSTDWNGKWGAVTWANGATGLVGSVGAANSLIGDSGGDQVGWDGITILTNGNYVVTTSTWIDTGGVAQGAVTWGSGTAGIVGTVSEANSLIGSHAYDQIGVTGITPLANGNYVVRSQYWDNDAVSDTGAVTLGNGASGSHGVVTPANSLVGVATNDYVGTGTVLALRNGNYVVASPVWDNGSVTDAGAVTWGNGITGISGAINANNSLVGTTNSDKIGLGGISVDVHGLVDLANGNYVVNSPQWNNGAATKAGAVTWGSGAGGLVGAVSAQNSLVGSNTNDSVGSGGITPLHTGHYVIDSPAWHQTAGPLSVGDVTFAFGDTGVAGAAPSSNSAIGAISTSLQAAVATDDVNNTFAVTFLGTSAASKVRLGSQFDGFATSTATTTTLSATPNASTGGQLVTFTATVSPSPGAGTVTFRDNGVAVAANVPVVSGVATYQTSSLSPGTHLMSAAYSGAGSFASSTSSTLNFTVSAAAPSVVSVTINGNIAALAGPQRSRVASLVVLFDQTVQLDANAMTLALHVNNVTFNGVAQPAGCGSLPTSLVVTPSGDNKTWTITFSGNTDAGADGFDSIKDGVYKLLIDAAKVHPSSDASVNMAASSTTVFDRLYGDTDAPGTPNGGTAGVDFSAIVNTGDNYIFRGAFNKPAPDYKAFLDFDGSGIINTGDNLEFRNRFNKALTWSV